MIALLVASLVLLTLGFGLVLRAIDGVRRRVTALPTFESLTLLRTLIEENTRYPITVLPSLLDAAGSLHARLDEHGRTGAAQFQALGTALDDHAAEILDRLPPGPLPRCVLCGKQHRGKCEPVDPPPVARGEKTVADIAAAVEAQHEAIREQVASHLRRVMGGAVSGLDARGVGEHAALQLRDARDALQRERNAVKDLTRERDYLRREAARLNDTLAKSHAEQDRLADDLKREGEESDRLRDSLTLSDQREAAAHAALDRASAPKSALLADRVRDLSVRVDERLGEVRANGEETAQRWLVLAHRRGQVLRDVRRALHVGAVDESDALSRFCAALAPRVEEGLSGEEGEAIHVTPPLTVLPWRPASEPPPAMVTRPAVSLDLPVRLASGRVAVACLWLNGRKWVARDRRIDDADPVTHWLPLEALQQTAESRPQPVATPETLGVRSEPGLERRLKVAAAGVVEHAVAVLRPLVPGGEGLDPASLCAAVRAIYDEADAALIEAHVVTQKSGSHYTLGQRVVILAGRERERDALRRLHDDRHAAAIDACHDALTAAGIPGDGKAQIPRPLLDRIGLLVAERDALAERVRQIRAVAFDPERSVLRKVAEIQRLLGHDGVKDPAVKPAPLAEFPHPLTGRDPLTATESPPAEYAAEADALGVQS